MLGLREEIGLKLNKDILESMFICVQLSHVLNYLKLIKKRYPLESKRYPLESKRYPLESAFK